MTRFDMEIDTIEIKMRDGTILIDSLDEDIYSIKPTKNGAMYLVRTTDHDFMFATSEIISIDVRYKEDY